MAIKHSLVVPCYNEEGNVEKFFQAAKESMKGYTDSYEIVFVNDGSSDGTLKKLKKIHAENPDVNVKVVSFSRNFGKEAAMYAGFKNAEGEYTTVIDADMQQHPDVAVEMGKLLDENPEYDMVAAYPKQRTDSPFLKKCKESFYKVINKTSQVKFINNASDFRTLRRKVVDAVLSTGEFHRFSKGIFSWVGFNTLTIPYDVHERESGESKWNFMKLLKYAFDGIIAYSDLPLKALFYMSGASAAAAFILLIVMIILQVVKGGSLVVGWVAVMLLCSLAAVLFGQGILGVYIGKIHTQVKGRPIYIVGEYLSYDGANVPEQK